VHWFNDERIHSALNWRPPIEYEQDYYDRQTTPDKQPLAG
jgi:transposase InsO family protein